MNESSRSSPRACSNCGTELTGRFCPACGQEDHSLAVPLYRLILDFLSDQFQFDSRLGRTLGLLLFRPGHLTRNYLAGQRQRYIPPTRLYLFFSIIFFLVVGLVPLNIQNVIHVNLAQMNMSGKGAVPATGTGIAAAISTIGKGMAGKLAPATGANPVARIKRRMAESAGAGAPAPGTTLNPLNQWFVAHFRAAKARPKEFWKQFNANLPKVLFFLIPLFALLLKVLYLLRKRFYSEHLVFALHYHSVLFINLLLVVALLALSRIAPAALAATARGFGIALGVWSLIYLVPAIRTVYGHGWWGAIWRSWLLWFVYFYMLVFGTVGAVMVTLAMS